MTQHGKMILADGISLELKHNNSIAELINQKTNTQRTFELRPQNGLENVLHKLDVDPNNIKKELDYLIDDISEHMIEQVGIDDYKKYRKLLKGLGYFFAEFLIEVKPCPEP